MTTETRVISPRGNVATFHVREGTSDLSVIGSSFQGVAGSPLVDEYGLLDTHVTGQFVDVGAHIGSVAIAVLLDNPDATAVLVEPIPENIAAIKANLAANGLTERATIIKGAVGTNHITYGWESDENLATNRYIGNLNVGNLAGGTRIRVRRVTAADLLPAAAMKVDCEGGEWALFADPGILGIPLIFGEFHGMPGSEGIGAIFGATHKIQFTTLGTTTGNFRAVAR